MSFDVASYVDSAQRVRDDDVDYTAFRDRPLSDAALRVLQYMSDVETHTICYLRDLLVTPSHKDPEVTAFLTMWAYEEYWHGEVLDRVLAAHERPGGAQRARDVRLAQGLGDKLAPILQSSAANLLGEDFVAVHMTFGAVNEWSTHAGYARLLALEPHPELRTLVGRIQRQETRHLAFYASQARARLARSARGRALTRWFLAHWWTPVGSSIMPRAETEFVLRHLLGGPDGARVVERLDAKVDDLPGLAGLRLVATGVGAFGAGPLAGAPRPRLPNALRALLGAA